MKNKGASFLGSKGSSGLEVSKNVAGMASGLSEPIVEEMNELAEAEMQQVNGSGDLGGSGVGGDFGGNELG